MNDINDPVVHQDRMMAAQKRFPGPQRVASTWSVVIGITEHHLPSLIFGRIRHPSTVGDLIIVARRNPVCWAAPEHVVDLPLIRDRILHRHANAMLVISLLLLVEPDEINDPELPRGGVAPLCRLRQSQRIREALVDGPTTQRSVRG